MLNHIYTFLQSVGFGKLDSIPVARNLVDQEVEWWFLIVFRAWPYVLYVFILCFRVFERAVSLRLYSRVVIQVLLMVWDIVSYILSYFIKYSNCKDFFFHFPYVPLLYMLRAYMRRLRGQVCCVTSRGYSRGVTIFSTTLILPTTLICPESKFTTIQPLKKHFYFSLPPLL